MGVKKIKKGLNLPITGEPVQEISQGNPVSRVAIVGDDYVGMKPSMVVKEGDTVKLGQVLFVDKKNPRVKFTSPGTGKLIEINRGEKRHFETIVIELDDKQEEITFSSYPADKLGSLDANQIIQLLIDSGMWTSLRVRPFSKVADPDHAPHSIFITAMDTNPLAPSIEVILKGNEEKFLNGLTVLSGLTEGKLYVCKSPTTTLPKWQSSRIVEEIFDGPHPSGNVGTHIHFLDPVSHHKHVWYIGIQDVIAIGYLFTTGKIRTDRIVSLAGPGVTNPRLVKTRLGACISELMHGEIKEGDNRLISGSVLSGRIAAGHMDYLGKYHQQVSVLAEGRERKFFGWLSLGFNLFSVKNILISSFFRNKKFAFNTAVHGGHRAVVPVGSYEKVMPLDILPTYLLRALAVKDVEESEQLGCLELDEEDLALCTYVCPSKIDHGINLRELLTLIEKEG